MCSAMAPPHPPPCRLAPKRYTGAAAGRSRRCRQRQRCSLPSRDSRLTLRQMRDYACEAAEMVQDRTRAHLDSDRMLNLALVRLLEILGEAANRVPTQARTQFAQIPWPQLIALRNRLIHGYDEVDLDVLWKIVATDLPPLIAELERILALPLEP